MKKGDKVNIYQDPITQKKLEGEAILIRQLDSNLGQWGNKILERWLVRFPDGIFERNILVLHFLLYSDSKKN